MEEKNINISKNINFGGLKIQTAIPPIKFNLITYVYGIEVDGNNWEFTYKTRAFWFMVLGAILPLIFKTIPFDWKVGLGIGFAAGMVFNLISWLIFKIKIKLYTKAIEEKYC